MVSTTDTPITDDSIPFVYEGSPVKISQEKVPTLKHTDVKINHDSILTLEHTPITICCDGIPTLEQTRATISSIPSIQDMPTITWVTRVVYYSR